MEYFDSRGVRRMYRVSLADGAWRSWRVHPGFDQRFSATLGPDAFEGLFEVAETPSDWQHDMKVTTGAASRSLRRRRRGAPRAMTLSAQGGLRSKSKRQSRSSTR